MMFSSQDEKICKLFVGGLSRAETFEEQLKEYFSQYGTITDSVVIKDNEQRSRGFGFVTMSCIDEADNVVFDKNEENNEKHSINGKEVEVKRATPRDVSTIHVRAQIWGSLDQFLRAA